VQGHRSKALEGSHRGLGAAGFGVEMILINPWETEETTKIGGSLGRRGLPQAAGTLGIGNHNRENDPGFRDCDWYLLHLPSSVHC